jgi:hypothetical protein
VNFGVMTGVGAILRLMVEAGVRASRKGETGGLGGEVISLITGGAAEAAEIAASAEREAGSPKAGAARDAPH